MVFEVARMTLPYLLLTLSILIHVRNSLAWSSPSSRRELFTRTFPSSLLLTTHVVTRSPKDAVAATGELPSFLRPFTRLAPLGSPQTSSNKTTNLSLQELADRLSKTLVQGDTGNGGYFLSGDLPTDIFRDDCVFVDPTNQVSSLSQYQNALRVLFDPAESTVELMAPLSVNEESRTISTTIRSRGVLQFPWRPRVKAYESNIVYSVDEDGLISRQSQTWTKSSTEALRESFTPSLFAPAPKSTLAASTEEPAEVTKLFHYLNGRRPDEYSQEERFEIAALIHTIAEARYPWKRDLLPGKWILTYLQPGPDGGGVDRRIPFPEFPFNDSYQVFGKDTVVNIGELFGPSLRVEVSGDLVESDPTLMEVPKRFKQILVEESYVHWRICACPCRSPAKDSLMESILVSVYESARISMAAVLVSSS